MSAAELAGKANGLGAWARKLNDAIDVIEGAHALEGQLGAAKQELERVKAEAANLEGGFAERKQKLEAELDALKADVKRRKDKATAAEREIEDMIANAATRAREIVEEARRSSDDVLNGARNDAIKIREEASLARAEADAIRETIAGLREEAAKMQVLRDELLNKLSGAVA